MFCIASAAVCCQSGSDDGPTTSICDSTDSMRSRTSFWKPFITDSTTISAATPRAMPNIEIIEINEMKVLRLARLLARVYRQPICHS
ncbi:hypothetical protein D9M72_577260 [compost metagenome]